MVTFEGLDDGAFDAVCIDNPWRFTTYSPKGTGRSADQHYKTMTMQEICDLPVKRLLKPNAWVFLWTTAPFLEKTFQLVGPSWGLKYSSTAFVWIKLQQRLERTYWRPGISQTAILSENDFWMGQGYTTRKNAEMCLLYKVGSPKRASKKVRELIFAPRREHSRKPDEAADRIREYCGPDANIAEIFSRTDRPFDTLWHTWGDEAGKFK
ncbi:MAG: DNA methyltransferase [Rhodobacteraceae bacterium]|nr:DNA methyltransferase [Paracoccaceae bacterium]